LAPHHASKTRFTELANNFWGTQLLIKLAFGKQYFSITAPILYWWSH